MMIFEWVVDKAAHHSGMCVIVADSLEEALRIGAAELPGDIYEEIIDKDPEISYPPGAFWSPGGD